MREERGEFDVEVARGRVDGRGVAAHEGFEEGEAGGGGEGGGGGGGGAGDGGVGLGGDEGCEGLFDRWMGGGFSLLIVLLTRNGGCFCWGTIGVIIRGLLTLERAGSSKHCCSEKRRLSVSGGFMSSVL